MSFDWNSIGDAEPSDRTSRLEGIESVGLYECEIDRCIEKFTRKQDTAFIVEFTIIKSDNKLHPVGAKRSWYQSCLSEMGPGHINAFVVAVHGLEKSATAEIAKLRPQMGVALKNAIGPNNTFCGRRVSLETYMIVTKKGEDFLVYRWSPHYGGNAAELPTVVEIAPPPPPPKPIFANGKWVLP